MDTDNITPLAKARDDAIILSLFLTLKKTGIIPNIVDKPAIPVTKKENIILFIIKYMFLLVKNTYLCYFITTNWK